MRHHDIVDLLFRVHLTAACLLLALYLLSMAVDTLFYRNRHDRLVMTAVWVGLAVIVFSGCICGAWQMVSGMGLSGN